MKPTADKLLIEADEPKTKTKSGILLQEDWKTLPPTGTVKAVGPEVFYIKEGDKVVFERYGAVTVDGSLKICKESHVLAVMEKE